MKPHQPPIILTTDFGLEDEYVGIVKAVLLTVNPAARIIDLTHAIAPQDVRRAAMLIGANLRYFPAGSVHLCVVDPGVGTKRRIIAVEGCGQLFVGPDNGVFTSVIESGGPVRVVEAANRDWFLEPVSATFHGRDIIAPVAARLALGLPLADAGPPVARTSCVTVACPEPVVTADGVRGEIIRVDRFGNLRTTISRAHLDAIAPAGRLEISLKGYVCGWIEGSYADLPAGAPAAIINSSGELEICVKNGSAATLTGAAVGDQVVVRG